MNRLRFAIIIAIVGGVTVVSSFAALLYMNDSSSGRGGVDVASLLNPRGPFSLVDHNGQNVTDKSYRGKFMLIFFGYTYCPDVCPTELQVIADALDLLGPDSTKVQPIFISVDHERDTPEALASYVSAFYPTLVGLTGTSEQIAAAAKSYYARYNKMSSLTEDEEKAGKKDEYYLIGHTSSTYLIGPNGRDLHVFNYGDPPEVMAERIQHFINSKF